RPWAADAEVEVRAGRGGRTLTPRRAPDFESGASACSAIPAGWSEGTTHLRKREPDRGVVRTPRDGRPAVGIGDAASTCSSLGDRGSFRRGPVALPWGRGGGRHLDRGAH